jgi:hypothetical protein
MGLVIRPYTELADAACCIWEAMIAARLDSNNQNNPIAKDFKRVGTAEMRGFAVNMADLCCDVWEHWGEEEIMTRPEPFDWEFVPLFLEIAYVDENQTVKGIYRKMQERLNGK